MIPLHSLLTPANSPADEKPNIDDFVEPQQNGQQNGPPVQQPGHHQATYAFPNAYQQGQPGFFSAPEQRHSSNEVNNGNGPGNPGNRVPIPRQDSTASNGNGPMSSDVVLPPRAKPGRKPMQDDNHEDRRRTQNRNAQRNFRDRRQQRLSEAMGQLESLNQELREAQAQHKVDINGLKQRFEAEIRKLKEENATLRKQLSGSEQDLVALRRDTAGDATLTGLAQPPSKRRMGPAPSNDTATHNASRPTTASSPIETDFTNFGRVTGAFRPGTASSPRSKGAEGAAASGNAEDASSPGLIMGIEGKEYSCGFCTDESNCLCRQNDAETAKTLVALSNGASSPESNKRKRGPDGGPDAEDSVSQVV